MNSYQNILDSWITIEQLSEGTINKKDKSYHQLFQRYDDWKQYFIDFLQRQKSLNKVSEKGFQKSGIVMYFGIFNFQEVIDILRGKYNIPSTYEEIGKSDKFTIALYFDNNLNFMADNLFLTMSGFIRNQKYLPDNLWLFESSENKLKENLSRKFEEDFNTAFTKLFNDYKVTTENFRYKFLVDTESSDVNLHSFFISDLNKARTINNEKLHRYINGFKGKRENLDSNKNSEQFNPTIFEEKVLQPKYYPLGRFPSNSDFALSFMQQVAVNLALNDENNVLSVNGPPGTGKTTLLKDIFAELIVQQAGQIVSRSNKKIESTLVYYKQAKFGILPSSISEMNIIVASSNNGAVQNIVNELPRFKEISEEFRNDIKEANYFTHISNCQLEKSFKDNKFNIKMTQMNDENWGAFSLEGGKSTNIVKLLLTIDSIVLDLKENYIDNPQVYTEFISLRDKLKKEREQMQKFSEKIYRLRKIQTKINEKENDFYLQQQKKQNELESHVKLTKSNIQLLEQELNDYNIECLNLNNQIEQIGLIRVQAERNYNVIYSQKPSFLWLKKVIFKTKVEEYFKQLNHANEELQTLSIKQKELLRQKQKIESYTNEKNNSIQRLKNSNQKKQDEYNKWLNSEQSKLENLKKELEGLKKEISSKNIKSIDFSLSYEELQKSNPWFNKEFRKLQSKLFILALKVRKQFLYENYKSLHAASLIWKKQGEHITKENGKQLITEAWNWINFAVPIVSTTLASFSRMFNYVKENSLGHLFIDEAGQALPQASVGAFFRCKKIMVVGDPSQIKPVLTLDSNVLTLIGRHYKVDEKYVSADASTQTLVDEAGQFGFYKNEDEWVGIPLWVHRRCNEPMFTIANTISYEGLMVQGKNEDDAKGKALWIDVDGKANDKYVQEQGDVLKDLIQKRILENPKLAKDIYVISPFKNVANQLIKILDQINFTIREGGKVINIGTVHTFQGKEAKIVYLVLGADNESKGAASWAVSDPNIMNVAATRAKEEFYVIGNKKLYASIGSRVANDTFRIIDKYNNSYSKSN